MQIIQTAGQRTQEAAASARLIDLQLIRQLLLTSLGWPVSNREFVLGVSAISTGRSGWFTFGHDFLGRSVLGYQGTEATVSQRVRRDLIAYECATFSIGRKLFNWQRGGGELKAITQYGDNFLNLAAIYIQAKADAEREPLPALARIDKLIPEALDILPQTIVKRRKRRKVTKVDTLQNCRLSNDAQGGSLEALSAQGRAALALSQKRLWIVPLHSAESGICSCRRGGLCEDTGKHPRIKYLHQQASAKQNKIIEWWSYNTHTRAKRAKKADAQNPQTCGKAVEDWSNSNVGVVTGKEIRRGWSYIVLDIDRRNGGDIALALVLDDLDIELPETYTVQTSDGEHYYLLVPTEVLCKPTQIGRGIDIKSKGMIVVGAGSVHRSGVVYTARDDDAPIAKMPPALVDLIFKQSYIPNRIIPEGERHKFLLACGGRLAGLGIGYEQVLATLRAERLPLCEPGARQISEWELRGIARYCVEQEQAKHQQKRGSAA